LGFVPQPNLLAGNFCAISATHKMAECRNLNEHSNHRLNHLSRLSWHKICFKTVVLSNLSHLFKNNKSGSLDCRILDPQFGKPGQRIDSDTPILA
jgi:hypothetical protein